MQAAGAYMSRVRMRRTLRGTTRQRADDGDDNDGGDGGDGGNDEGRRQRRRRRRRRRRDDDDNDKDDGGDGGNDERRRQRRRQRRQRRRSDDDDGGQLAAGTRDWEAAGGIEINLLFRRRRRNQIKLLNVLLLIIGEVSIAGRQNQGTPATLCPGIRYVLAPSPLARMSRGHAS
jgi:hypothetical protein